MSPRLPGARSGWWWVLVLSGLITAVVVAFSVVPLIGHEGGLMRGKLGEIDTYGFDLSNLDVPRDLLIGGARVDELNALTSPERVTPDEADQITRERRKRHQDKFLVDDDRVVGVHLGGEARAYPVRILNWHEVINDTVGGVPLAVTFSGLCDSAVVLDRRMDGEVVEFGTSGMLFNSNLVIYDRRADGAERSLWSQLALRAISGPRLGHELQPLPMSVTTWGEWKGAHPDTTVVAGRVDYIGLYKRDPYAAYLRNPGLKFPVRPVAAGTSPGPKTPMLAVWREGQWRVRPLAAEGEAIAGVHIDPGSEARAPTFLLDEDAELPAVHTLWFAWNAIRGVSDGEGELGDLRSSTGFFADARDLLYRQPAPPPAKSPR